MRAHRLGRFLRFIAGGMALVAVTPAYAAPSSEDANPSQNQGQIAWAAGGQPEADSFIARAAPLPVMQPGVPSPRKESCLRGVEGVHKVSHRFLAPSRGVLDVEMDDFQGDWDLYVLTETGESLGASEGSQVLEEALAEEGLVVHLEPHQPVDMVACNWLGELQVTVHFTFHRTFAPPEGLLVYATCPGADVSYYSCAEPEVGSIPVQAEVFTLSATDHMPQRVTHNDLRELFPVWSPDGEQAAGYGKTRRQIRIRKACGLYTFGLRTGETTRLAGSRRFCPQPNDWSSDGRWILAATATDSIGDLYKIRPDGSGLTALTDHDWDTWVGDASFVGHDIVYDKSAAYGGDGIVRMNGQGRNKRWLKRGCVTSLGVSPDDRWIAYGHCRPSGRAEDEVSYVLYLMRPNGSRQMRIHRGAFYIEDVVFSPDGTKIAFAAWSDKAARLRVYDLAADTLLDIPLPKGAEYLDEVTWSPSGTYLAYSASLANEPGSAAYFARVGGERAYRLTKASYEHSLFTWLPPL
ncbi:MAG TPA: hypothetical protein VHN37_02020 [Actinomycetota bacterium]|nr:hypothetical protein [Actinomycetota bacterium]